MRVFVTGATGWVGGALVPELIGHGHQVVGLARSGEALQKLQDAGAEGREGGLDDLDTMASAARECDAVVHLAFRHDLFHDYAKAVEIDGKAITAMLNAIEGTGKPMVGTSGLSVGVTGRAATEEDAMGEFARGVSENLLLGYADRGVRAMVVRLASSVHGKGDQGFVPTLGAMAQKNGFAAYIGDGANEWSGVPRQDAAVLYRLALEKGTAGARYHGVEESIPTKRIAEAIGGKLGLPTRSLTQEEANETLEWMGRFLGMNLAGTSTTTRRVLGWEPKGIGLLEDIEENYFG